MSKNTHKKAVRAKRVARSSSSGKLPTRKSARIAQRISAATNSVVSHPNTLVVRRHTTTNPADTFVALEGVNYIRVGSVASNNGTTEGRLPQPGWDFTAIMPEAPNSHEEAVRQATHVATFILGNR